MASRLSGALSDLEMAARRRADEHRVGSRGERGVEILEHRQPELGFDVTALVALQRFGDDVRQAPAPVGEQLEPVTARRAEIAGVPLADRAESRDQNAHATPRSAE